MTCGMALKCESCDRTGCPDNPPPKYLENCAGCGRGVYDDEERYEIDGQLVHYDCLHEYHKNDIYVERKEGK